MTEANSSSTAWGRSLTLPTLGGLQFWTDELYFRDWRIQRHARTGHYRLLDGWSFRHALGDFSHCQAVLDDIIVRRQLKPWSGPTVILIHGIVRTRHCMDSLGRYLTREGFHCHSMSYASTQAPLADHARSLKRIVENLPCANPIHLVGFSMGGLVARAYLALGKDPRVQRLVTIGTPHQGAEKAHYFKKAGLINIAGPAALELMKHEEGPAHQLEPNPARTFGIDVGIIAGGGPWGLGFSSVVPRDNDGVVSIASNRLAGASDFIRVHGHHTFLPSQRSVKQLTAQFLKHGYFRSPESREPIPHDDRDLPEAVAPPTSESAER